MKTFLISDLHFNHKRIPEFCPESRPYESMEEMNWAIINKWNNVVGKNDETFVLGDFAFSENNSTMDNEFIFDSLNGSKHLVIGNHDEKNKKILRLPWASQAFLRDLKRDIPQEDGSILKVRIVLCHYPLETWKNLSHGYVHAHGHSHGGLKRKIGRRLDVGFDSDVTNGYPLEIGEFYKMAIAQEFEAADHHSV